MSGTLIHSPADIVARAIVALLLGNEPPSTSWPVYTSNEPNSPDSTITLYDKIGTNSGRTMTDGERQEHHGVQVRVRATSHVNGWTKIRAIAVAVDQTLYQMTVSIDGTNYFIHCVTRTGEIISLGREITPNATASEPMVSNRHLFVFNAVVSVRQLSIV